MLLHRVPQSRMKSLGILVLTLTALAGHRTAMAAESADDQLKLTTDRVVVFKDGYYLALKSGTAVTNNDGEIVLLDVPDNAVLGSFWATSTKGKLTAMVASRETIIRTEEKSIPCTQMIELLQANIGQKARIVMHDKSSPQGEILRVLTEPTVSALSPGLSALLNPPGPDGKHLPPAGGHTGDAPALTVSGIAGSQFILRTDDGDTLLQVGQIQTLTIKDMKVTQTRTVTSTSTPKRLTLRFAEANRPVDVTLMYFQPGLRWIPTYRINLLDAEKKLASIDMQAEFLNEAEDLVNVPVDIVVGVPNFRFKDTPSPLIMEKMLRNVLVQAAPQLMSQQMSNSTFASRSGERFQPQIHEAPAAAALPADLEGGNAQDLFVYHLKSLKLAKGERAAMPLITAQVPFRSVYTWDVHLTRNEVEHGMGPGARNVSPQSLSENRVWHQIVLTNTTKAPWTTGAAILMQGHQPLSQDLLTYTSVGAEVRIPVTISVDTQGTYAEEETERKLGALTVHGQQYARIEKLASLNVINRKPLPVELEITFRTGGKAENASDDGKITLNSHSPADWINYNGHAAVNNSSQVVWKVTIKPGATFSPTVKYHYFSRH
jgi:hypothetical protein